MAPSVAAAKPRDKTQRGIDVVVDSVEQARIAQRAVKAALASAGHADAVRVWLWQPSSSGVPATPVGRTAGRELRLAAVFAGRR